MLRWPLLADHLLQLSLPAEADRKVILVQPHTNERAELDRSAGARSLKAAKAHGVVLGNPKLDDVPERAVASTEAEADRFAKNVVPIIRDIQSSGAAETSQQNPFLRLNLNGELLWPAAPRREIRHPNK